MTTSTPSEQPAAGAGGRSRARTHARVSALVLSVAAFGGAWTAIVRADTGPGGPLAAVAPDPIAAPVSVAAAPIRTAGTPQAATIAPTATSAATTAPAASSVTSTPAAAAPVAVAPAAAATAAPAAGLVPAPAPRPAPVAPPPRRRSRAS